MREIKFRAWNTRDEVMDESPYHFYFEANGNCFAYEDWRDLEDGRSYPCELMQYTGLKDKNGVEIYEGEVLRIKGKMGDNSEYSFDALYKVEPITYEGLELRFLKLYCKEPDSKDNSYPICTHPCIRYNSLTNDYVNQKYDQIALPMTSGRNAIQRTSWVEHQYTNDIEVIGNIHQHPHLLQ